MDGSTGDRADAPDEPERDEDMGYQQRWHQYREDVPGRTEMVSGQLNPEALNERRDEVSHSLNREDPDHEGRDLSSGMLAHIPRAASSPGTSQDQPGSCSDR